MKTNQAGIDLIKHFEGLRLEAYLDTGGVPTIGYGHTRGVRIGDTITEDQADRYLVDDLSDAERAVERYVAVPLNSNQFSALVSFTYNLGAGQLSESTLLRMLNDGYYQGASDQFKRWVYDDGVRLDGLVRRREAEQRLFDTPTSWYDEVEKK